MDLSLRGGHNSAQTGETCIYNKPRGLLLHGALGHLGLVSPLSGREAPEPKGRGSSPGAGLCEGQEELLAAPTCSSGGKCLPKRQVWTGCGSPAQGQTIWAVST